LKKKRVEFWSSRIEGDPNIWNTLKACCDTDDLGTIKVFLDAAGIKLYKKSLVISFDSLGNIYEIPNYCVSYPLVYDESKFEKNKPEEKLMNLTFRNLNKEIKMKCSNLLKIEKIIETITISLNNDDKSIKQENIKLFYSGKPLKKEEFLWNYKIDEECVIQIFIIKIPD